MPRNIISPAQYGFKEEFLNSHNRVILSVNILGAFEKESVALIMCHLACTVFGIIFHDILLRKLKHNGIYGTVLRTFESYLSGRMQVVSVKGDLSNQRPVLHGVRQGSILGPILLNLVAIG